MKYITFPQSRSSRESDSIPSDLVRITQNGRSHNCRLFKASFSKEEARHILKHRQLYFIQESIDASPPVIAFKNPYGKDFKSIASINYIAHELKYSGYTFLILLCRDWNNSKVKAHEFEITLYDKGVPYTKAGQLPGNLLSKGKGWLKEVIDVMVKERKGL